MAVQISNLTVQQLAALFGIDEDEVMRRVRGGRRKSGYKCEDTKGAVLALMEDGQARHVAAVSEGTGIKLSKVRAICYALAAERKLVKTSAATFRAPGEDS